MELRAVDPSDVIEISDSEEPVGNSEERKSVGTVVSRMEKVYMCSLFVADLLSDMSINLSA